MWRGSRTNVENWYDLLYREDPMNMWHTCVTLAKTECPCVKLVWSIILYQVCAVCLQGEGPRETVGGRGREPADRPVPLPQDPSGGADPWQETR